MMEFSIILVIVWCIIFVMIVYGIIRNEQIYRMRSRVNNEIYNLFDYKKSLKLYSKYHCMSYGEMMSIKNVFVPIKKLEATWKRRMGFNIHKECKGKRRWMYKYANYVKK